MFDEHFWLAIAFTLFAVFFVKYCLPLLIRSIDAKSKLIADEIAAAQKMKEDAKNLLEAAESHYRESVQFAEKIIKDAEDESKKTIELADLALETEVSKKTNALMSRLKTEEESAIRQVKSHIINSAIQSLHNNVSREIGEKDHERLMAKSAENVAGN